MCGILGVISYNNVNTSDEESVIDMQKEILHRGPDNQSIWRDNSVVYGHNRLSIIDLSNQANQPMLSVDKDIVICFNGEVYNHEEIKEELLNSQKFNTDHSDTEVIINAYKEWGIDKTLSKLKGMFAFSLYDIKNNVNYIVRDRLGKKPVFYTLLNNKLVFASEVKALLSLKDIDKTINDEAIYHYLSLLTVNAPNTFFKHISKLEAGTYIRYTSNNKVVKKTYWNITEHINKQNSDSYEDAVNTIEKKLKRSMVYRNVSDVPISLALSGGVDSSMNLYYSSQKNKQLNAINLDYETQHEFSESKNAKRFSEALGVKYTQMQINQTIFEEELFKLCEIQKDMPFGDPNSVLLYYIAKEANRQKSKIILVGEGGDELGGYPVYSSMDKEQKIISKIPKALRSLLKYIPLRKRYDFFYKGNLVSRRQIHGFTEYDKKQFWKGKKYNSYKILYDLMQQVKDKTPDDFLRKVLNIEYKLRLPELILARVDYPTMAASIEARSPYMDYELIEYCAGLSYDLKMKNGAKSMIKDVANTVLPSYIVNAKKVGFGMLLTPFLSESLPKIFEKEIIKEVSAPIKEYIKESFLINLHKKSGNEKIGYQLWIIYSLNKWLKIQN